MDYHQDWISKRKTLMIVPITSLTNEQDGFRAPCIDFFGAPNDPEMNWTLAPPYNAYDEDIMRMDFAGEAVDVKLEELLSGYTWPPIDTSEQSVVFEETELSVGSLATMGRTLRDAVQPRGPVLVKTPYYQPIDEDDPFAMLNPSTEEGSPLPNVDTLSQPLRFLLPPDPVISMSVNPLTREVFDIHPHPSDSDTLAPPAPSMHRHSPELWTDTALYLSSGTSFSESEFPAPPTLEELPFNACGFNVRVPGSSPPIKMPELKSISFEPTVPSLYCPEGVEVTGLFPLITLIGTAAFTRAAPLVAEQVNRTVRDEWRACDAVDKGTHQKSPTGTFTSTKKRRRRAHDAIEFRPVSVFTALGKRIEKKHEGVIPQSSCFGLLNMRPQRAWTRRSVTETDEGHR